MKHTREAAALTDLILEVFRLNGQLLVAGDRLTRPLGLTSARWQVLGAIELAGQPITVAQASRRMGVSRQAVQRVANDLAAAGFVTFEDNPDHARAKLIRPTRKGMDALERLSALQADWSNALASGTDAARLADAFDLLRVLRLRCEDIETALAQAEA